MAQSYISFVEAWNWRIDKMSSGVRHLVAIQKFHLFTEMRKTRESGSFRRCICLEFCLQSHSSLVVFLYLLCLFGGVICIDK